MSILVVVLWMVHQGWESSSKRDFLLWIKESGDLRTLSHLCWWFNPEQCGQMGHDGKGLPWLPQEDKIPQMELPCQRVHTLNIFSIYYLVDLIFLLVFSTHNHKTREPVFVDLNPWWILYFYCMLIWYPVTKMLDYFNLSSFYVLISGIFCICAQEYILE